MTRKRFKKLLMSMGASRNDADAITRIVGYLNQHPETVKLAKEATTDDHTRL